MMRFINKYLLIVVGVCTAAMLGFINYQSHKIDRLSQALSYAKEQIQSLQEANLRLELTLEQEKSAVEKQAVLVNQYKTQAEVKQEKVRYVLRENQCANTAMPDVVIKQLQ